MSRKLGVALAVLGNSSRVWSDKQCDWELQEEVPGGGAVQMCRSKVFPTEFVHKNKPRETADSTLLRCALNCYAPLLC